MTHLARVRPEAENDIDEYAEYYDGEQTGLGSRFVAAVFSEIDIAAHYPNKHREEFDDVRIALISKFPFGVFFLVEGDEIIVLAVQDLRRSVRRRLEEIRKRLKVRDTEV